MTGNPFVELMKFYVSELYNYMVAPKFGILVREVTSQCQTMICTLICTFFHLYLTSPSNLVPIVLVASASIQPGNSLQILALMSLGCFFQCEQSEAAAFRIMLCTKPAAIQKRNMLPWHLLHSAII